MRQESSSLIKTPFRVFKWLCGFILVFRLSINQLQWGWKVQRAVSAKSNIRRGATPNLEGIHSRIADDQWRGLVNLIERSRNMPQEPFDTTTAVCHKPLFGSVDMWTVIDWAVYHHMLGFDRIFIYYTPEMRELDGFDVLDSLDYVTFTEVHGYAAQWGVKSFVETEEERKGKLRQEDMMFRCVYEDAKDFDWVLYTDADEYLWFNETIGVKEFIAKQDSELIYMSFGKSMYTNTHTVRSAEASAKKTGFYLTDFPFAAGLYCPIPNTTDTCPSGDGRSKVMIKPKLYKPPLPIHGTRKVKKMKTGIHFSGKVAHLKEWRGANSLTSQVPIVLPKGEDFISDGADVYIHKFTAYLPNTRSKKKKIFTMHYDADLAAWFDYVASRAQKARSFQ